MLSLAALIDFLRVDFAALLRVSSRLFVLTRFFADLILGNFSSSFFWMVREFASQQAAPKSRRFYPRGKLNRPSVPDRSEVLRHHGHATAPSPPTPARAPAPAPLFRARAGARPRVGKEQDGQATQPAAQTLPHF